MLSSKINVDSHIILVMLSISPSTLYKLTKSLKGTHSEGYCMITLSALDMKKGKESK